MDIKLSKPSNSWPTIKIQEASGINEREGKEVATSQTATWAGYLNIKRRPDIRILRHLLPVGQIQLLRASRSQPLIQRHVELRLQNPNPGIVALHLPVAVLLPPLQPPGHRRIGGQRLRQRVLQLPHVLRAVVEHDAEVVGSHQVVQHRHRESLPRPDRRPRDRRRHGPHPDHRLGSNG